MRTFALKILTNDLESVVFDWGRENSSGLLGNAVAGITQLPADYETTHKVTWTIDPDRYGYGGAYVVVSYWTMPVVGHGNTYAIQPIRFGPLVQGVPRLKRE